MKKHTSLQAFTIMEIMVVVIIIGIIAAFAIPNYNTSVNQSHLQDAIIQLSAIRSANQLYYAKTATYWPTTADNDVSAINTALSLNIIENGMTYNCDGSADPGVDFTCSGTPTSGTYTVTVDQNPLSATNPSCAGSCP